MCNNVARRTFIKQSLLASACLPTSLNIMGKLDSLDVKVVNPLCRVPVSFIIDDSTALVNLAHFGIPQFAEVFPKQYLQDWRKLPREIPDSFVREFGEWCSAHGVKGKYSMVPYPACTGWLHRNIPGWTNQQLKESLALVRDFMQPNWDIHPEMISHTRVIDLKTGLPYPFPTADYMENWEWSQTKSADELGAYLAYALNILKEAGLYCEGITTPGGFGSRNKVNLALGTLQAIQEVYQINLAHFFRDVITTPGTSVEPVLYHASGLHGSQPQVSVHIIGCTDDWFGGWDGLERGHADHFITPDLQKGRMVEVINAGEPAIMVCHWPGIYFNGKKTGFKIFKTVVERLHQKYDHLLWMKNSEIARYWAAKKLTEVSVKGDSVELYAPFATEKFTMEISRPISKASLVHLGQTYELKMTSHRHNLQDGFFCVDGHKSYVSFPLKQGSSQLTLKLIE